MHAAVTNQPFMCVAGCRSMPFRKCMGGSTWTLKAAALRVGAVVFERKGLRGQDHRESETVGTLFLATTDSIRQQHRTAFCALKHTRSAVTNQLFVMWTAGCRLMLLRKRMGGRTWSLRLEGAGPGEQGGTSSTRSFWFVGNNVSRFHLDVVVLFRHVSGF